MKLKEYLETRKISKNIFKVIALVLFMTIFNSLSYAYFTSTIEGEGKEIVLSTSDTSFNSIGKTGGSKSINLEHSHTTKDHKLTIAEMPSHGHALRLEGQSGLDPGAALRTIANDSRATFRESSYGGHAGGDQPHNHGETTSSLSSLQSILNPYIVSAKWIRVS